MENQKLIRRFPAGMVTPPPSKSLTHRAVICAAFAARGTGRESIVYNVAVSEDIAATLSGIEALGCVWREEGSGLVIGPGGERKRSVGCGESGTTLRLLIPMAALDAGETLFTGRGRLMERPMEAYADAGLALWRKGETLAVEGPLKSGVYSLPGDVSSQFISGLLLALPLLPGDSEIRLTTPLESEPYVAMTLGVMERYGVQASKQGPDRYLIPGGQCYVSAEYTVEPDYSQAAFFLAAAALGRDVRCGGMATQSVQGDSAILAILRDMGATVTLENSEIAVTAGRLLPVTVDARDIPDLVPPVAALMCFCEGESRIVNAGRLRYKESDRLRALATELRNLGARIEETTDGLVITGSPSLPGGAADAWNDHRIAMAVALASIRCDGPVKLTRASSVNKSYPGFWDEF